MTIADAARAIASSIERRSIAAELELLFVEIAIWNADLEAVDRWESEGGQ